MSKILLAIVSAAILIALTSHAATYVTASAKVTCPECKTRGCPPASGTTLSAEDVTKEGALTKLRQKAETYCRGTPPSMGQVSYSYKSQQQRVRCR